MTAPCEFWDLVCRTDAHEGLAAWVQAVGSVAAILIAVATGWFSGKESRDNAKAELVRRVELVLGLGWHIAHFSRQVTNTFDQPQEQPSPVNLVTIHEVIDRYPVDQFPSAELAWRLLGMRRLSIAFLDAYQNWLTYRQGVSIAAGGRGPTIMAGLVSEIEAEYLGLAQAGQELLTERGGRKLHIPVHREVGPFERA